MQSRAGCGSGTIGQEGVALKVTAKRWPRTNTDLRSLEIRLSEAAENHFLGLVCARLRSGRPPIPSNRAFTTRVETVAGAPFVSLWFRTRGCRHDACGGCTMCDYGASPPVAADEMVAAVRDGLATLEQNGRTLLLLSPSGSMFDDWEVPADARRRILELASQTCSRSILCESRAETVTEKHVAEFARILDGREAGVEIGLESANPWVLKYCINKGMDLNDYLRAIATLGRYGVGSTANVLLGAPFMSEAESIDDAVKSIQWALSSGTSQAVLFPAHVKRYTLLQWLWERNMYAPPSLWSLAEVVSRLGPHLASKVTISWYRNYLVDREAHDNTEDLSFLASPATCPRCREAVVDLLDQYRDTGDFSIMTSLLSFDCDCRRQWRATIEKPICTRLAERVAVTYEAIGRDVLGEYWWLSHGADVTKGVLKGRSGSSL